MRTWPKSQHKQYSSRTVLLLTLGLSALLLLPTIFWNFTYDQGTFAYGGSAILNGERPYIDFWDIKPPNIFYTYATAFTLFGQSVRAIRFFDYLNALLTIGLMFVLGVRMWKNTPWRHLSAVMASLAFVLQFYILGDWNTAQVENYSLPWVLAAMLLVIPYRTRDNMRRLMLRAALAGLAISITVFFKFPNGLYIILVGGALWLHSGKERKEHYRAIGALLSGFIAGLGVQILYLWFSGELEPLWHITTSSTLGYISNNYSGAFSFYQNLRVCFSTLDLLWVIMGIIGWSFWGSDHHPRAKHTHSVFLSAMLLVLGVVISLMIVQFQNKGYTYHYVMLLPWADLLIGAGMGHIARLLHQLDTLPRGNNAAMLVVAMFALSYVWTSHDTLHSRVADITNFASGDQPANGYIANDSLANYVIARTRPTDRLFIFGFEPYVYWKTGRRPANRYLNTIHFKPSYVPADERAELVHSLTSNPPELFLVETGDNYTSQGNSNEDSRSTIRNHYPEIEQLLATRYIARDTVQHTIAYVLKSN